MEFLVEFGVNIPDGAPPSEVADRERSEADAAAKLADEGHLARVWTVQVAPGETRILGLYLAKSREEADALLGALPLYDSMRVSVTQLDRHPNDPAATRNGTDQP